MDLLNERFSSTSCSQPRPAKKNREREREREMNLGDSIYFPRTEMTETCFRVRHDVKINKMIAGIITDDISLDVYLC
ncbi:hypothetical protein VTO42DRAFT_5886 [Malbranchea cinnamomea]